jgi:hypothetical protein
MALNTQARTLEEWQEIIPGIHPMDQFIMDSPPPRYEMEITIGGVPTVFASERATGESKQIVQWRVFCEVRDYVERETAAGQEEPVFLERAEWV